jgi:hypothetical protein
MGGVFRAVPRLLLPDLHDASGRPAARHADDAVRLHLHLLRRRADLDANGGNDRSIVNALAIITTIAVTHYTIIALKQRYPAFGRVESISIIAAR